MAEPYVSPLGIESLVDQSAVGARDHISRLAEALIPHVDAGGTAVDPRWDDLRVSMSRGQAAAGTPSWETFKGNVSAYAFGTGDALGFDCQVPHDALLGPGAELRPHVHWSPGNSTGTGTVQWTLDVEWANAEAEPDNEFVTLSGSPLAAPQAGAGVAYRHQLASFPAIDAALFRPSVVLVCRLTRIASGDTFSGDVFALSVDFHYRRVSAGSVAEYGP